MAIQDRPRARQHMLPADVAFELVDASSDAIVVIDESGRIVFFNQGAEKTFGYHCEQAVGQPMEMLLPLEARPRHVAMRRAFAGSAERNLAMDSRRRLCGRRADGTEFPASITVVRTTRGRSTRYMAAIVRDVTEVAAEHDALAEREAWFRAVVDQTADVIIVIDDASTVSYANPAARSTIGAAARRVEQLDGWLDAVAASDRAAVRAAVVEATQHSTTVALPDFAVTDPRGSQRLLEGIVVGTSDHGAPTAIVVARDVTSTRAAWGRLIDLTMRDPLTGVANRTGLAAYLDGLDPACDVCVGFLDLDEFKAINDNRGHDFGDAVLVAVSSRLRQAVRAGDLLARVGGDEFVVISGGCVNDGAAEGLERRVAEVFRDPFMIGDERISVRGSFGAVRGTAGSAAELIQSADQAMYLAKRSRRGLYRRAGAPAGGRATVDPDTHQVARQPILDRDLQMVGYELLHRVPNDVGAPAGNPHDATVSVAAFALVTAGLDELVGAGMAFINATSRFLADRAYELFPPQRLVLEITEDTPVDSTLVADIEAARAAGYAIALDDHVPHGPHAELLPLVDMVKLEVHVCDDAEIARRVDVVRSSNPKARLIAEKVEEQDRFWLCRDLGFDLYQGYFLARPERMSRARPVHDVVGVLRLIDELAKPGCSLGRATELVAAEPALARLVLRIARRPGGSLADAVTTVGLQALRQLGLLAAMASDIAPPAAVPSASERSSGARAAARCLAAS